MNLEHYYWCFQKVVPERLCDEIVKYALSIKDKMALVGGLNTQKLNPTLIKDLKKTRDSNVVWLDERWIYNEIQPYITQANINAGWNFQWDWTEACQFTKYSKGQYYNWHCDSWRRAYNSARGTPRYGKIRKLSLTLSLSDEKSYKGGELEFDFRDVEREKQKTQICKEVKPKGSLVVFPSDVWHRVNPVKQGYRYSLVAWNLGLPFK